MNRKPLRCLIVGLGSVGRRHLANLRSLGCRDILAVRVRGLPVAELGDVPVFTSLEAALDREPNVVFVANPTSLHLATARQAIERGCHVFVEKPLSHTAEGVGPLLRAARERGVVGTVGYQMRFHPSLQHLERLLDQGAIGRPLSARVEYGEYLPDWHPGEDYRAGYSARRDLGGGPILTLSHALDLAYWLFGRPERIACLAGHVSALEVDTEDTADMLLHYPGGLLCSVHVDYLRRPPRRGVEVVGEAGVLRWDDASSEVEWYQAGAQSWTVEPAPLAFTRNQMFLDELAHFLDCVQSGQQPPVGLEDGACVLAMALAALASAESGHLVSLDSVFTTETQRHGEN
ncbi:MAG: Gfo/Idh/MocA family oxidoreductase [Chloroflexi bacterium]|nr:Gfo/Idh/MocA family oxidoreductase [Chloroflexota bacterium]